MNVLNNPDQRNKDRNDQILQVRCPSVLMGIYCLATISLTAFGSTSCTKGRKTPPSASYSGKTGTQTRAPEETNTAKPAQKESAPKTPQDTGKKPRIVLKTTLGQITLELFPDKAPKSVANFLSYVRSGHYNGTIFHRVIANFMIQGGGFDANFKRKPTKSTIENEADNGLKNSVGTVAMARTSDPHSASAQFFINVKDNSFLNFKSKTRQGWGYAVFGRVISGMEVVNKIRQEATGAKGPFPSDVPQRDIVIESATIVD